MTDAERSYMLQVLVRVPVPMFRGDLEDLVKFHEMYMLRIGPDDEWLKRLYDIHIALIADKVK